MEAPWDGRRMTKMTKTNQKVHFNWAGSCQNISKCVRSCVFGGAQAPNLKA